MTAPAGAEATTLIPTEQPKVSKPAQPGAVSYREATKNIEKLQQQILNPGAYRAEERVKTFYQNGANKTQIIKRGLDQGDEYEIKRSKKVDAYKIRPELMEFYVEFFLQMQLKNPTDDLHKFKGKFDWNEFQSFTQTVSQGAAPFANLEDDPVALKWLLSKLEAIWESKLNEKEEQLAQLNGRTVKDNQLVSQEILGKFGKLEGLVRFYFDLFDSTVNPNFQDRHFGIGGKKNQHSSGDVFVNLFYQMADEVSEGAAPFLNHRSDPDMANYIKYLRYSI